MFILFLFFIRIVISNALRLAFSLTHFSQNYFHSIVRVLDIFYLMRLVPCATHAQHNNSFTVEIVETNEILCWR